MDVHRISEDSHGYAWMSMDIHECPYSWISMFMESIDIHFPNGNQVIIEKFKMITGIEERRYAAPHFNTSDLGFFAATKAIEDAKLLSPRRLPYEICDGQEILSPA